jgi:hypothetical protein
VGVPLHGLHLPRHLEDLVQRAPVELLRLDHVADPRRRRNSGGGGHGAARGGGGGGGEGPCVEAGMGLAGVGREEEALEREGGAGCSHGRRRREVGGFRALPFSGAGGRGGSRELTGFPLGAGLEFRGCTDGEEMFSAAPLVVSFAALYSSAQAYPLPYCFV